MIISRLLVTLRVDQIDLDENPISDRSAALVGVSPLCAQLLLLWHSTPGRSLSPAHGRDPTSLSSFPFLPLFSSFICLILSHVLPSLISLNFPSQGGDKKHPSLLRRLRQLHKSAWTYREFSYRATRWRTWGGAEEGCTAEEARVDRGR